MIPAAHGRAAHEIVPNSRLVEIEGSGHWPMLDSPTRFTDELSDFIEGTEPFEYSEERVRERLKRGPR